MHGDTGDHETDPDDLRCGGDLGQYDNPGEDCFLLKVHVPAVDALAAILDQFLLHGQTTSSFIVSTPVAPRTPGRS